MYRRRNNTKTDTNKMQDSDHVVIKNKFSGSLPEIRKFSSAKHKHRKKQKAHGKHAELIVKSPCLENYLFCYQL